MTARQDALVFPRGNVFHLPPANVDTIFVYSWAISALAGNHNVVRISSRSAGAAEVILEDQLLASLRSGTTATFIIFQTPEEGIGIPISLNGFGPGFDSLP